MPFVLHKIGSMKEARKHDPSLFETMSCKTNKKFTLLCVINFVIKGGIYLFFINIIERTFQLPLSIVSRCET